MADGWLMIYATISGRATAIHRPWHDRLITQQGEKLIALKLHVAENKIGVLVQNTVEVLF